MSNRTGRAGASPECPVNRTPATRAMSFGLTPAFVLAGHGPRRASRRWIVLLECSGVRIRFPMRTIFPAAIVLFSPPAMSCGCSAPRSTAEVDKGSIIFKGRVASVVPTSRTWSVGNSPWKMKSYDVTFDVIEPIRGVDSPHVTVSFRDEGSTSCDLLPVPLKIDTDWLLSATGGSGRYSNDFCDLREQIQVGEIPTFSMPDPDRAWPPGRLE